MKLGPARAANAAIVLAASGAVLRGGELRDAPAEDNTGAVSIMVQLAEQEASLPGNHPELAITPHNLAEVYRVREHLRRAEDLLRNVVTIREAALGPNGAEVARSLNSLAAVPYRQGEIQRAEPSARRAHRI